ncbi:MAG TPA: TIGR03435 family protein [Bryobacteraceae bacterium]|nr:TIGR03435 family protein [Bryobacteraceae bacterium]
MSLDAAGADRDVALTLKIAKGGLISLFMLLRITLCLLLAVAARGQVFEVASIKPHPVSVNQPIMKNPDVNPIRISGNRVELTMIGLKGLVMAAYNVKEYQVSGGPAWASRIDSLWDIAAKTPGDGRVGIDRVRMMLQDLLTERFRLKLRRETKQLPVYNLVVAKGGPKLKVAPATQPAVRGMRRGTMDQLAALLSVMVGRPVIDKTGLPGTYDYSNEIAALDVGAQDWADTISRTLAAIHGQFGLKVEPSKAMIEILTIQGAEEPTEN